MRWGDAEAEGEGYSDFSIKTLLDLQCLGPRTQEEVVVPQMCKLEEGEDAPLTHLSLMPAEQEVAQTKQEELVEMSHCLGGPIITRQTVEYTCLNREVFLCSSVLCYKESLLVPS